MQQKKVWALKHRDQRKKSIISVLKQYDKLTMVDLIKKHHKEIGVALPESGKIIHQAWEVVRTDCKKLAKENKLKMDKDNTGRILLYLPGAKQEMKDKETNSEKEIALSKETISEHTYNWKEIAESINALNEKVLDLRNQVMEIWKHIAKISAEEVAGFPEREEIVNSLEDIINKLKY